MVKPQVSETGAQTLFRLTGDGQVTNGAYVFGEWQTYDKAIRVRQNLGEQTTIEYYSVDAQGNQESTKSLVLQ